MTIHNLDMCCYCGIKLAAGRVVYVGLNDKIVDNMFCNDHRALIFIETCHLLDLIHTGLNRDYILEQTWNPGCEHRPSLPATKGEFFRNANKRIFD